MLEGGVGQHDAQLGQAVGQTGGEGGARALLQQHDGALRALERGSLGVVHLADAANVGRRGSHHRERLALAALAGAQERHGVGVVRVAHQVETAEALHGQNLPRTQQLHGAREDGIALCTRFPPDHRAKWRSDGVGGVTCFTCSTRALFEAYGGHGGVYAGQRAGQALVLAPAQVRPALEARVGLRVEAAVERVAVLAGAALAHGEVLHRRALAVVGQLLDDGEARPAVRAVDERVAVAPVVGVEQLAHAVVARGQVGRHERGLLHRAGVREADLEGVEVLQRNLLERHFFDARGGRRVLGQLDDELVEQLRLALGMDEHAVGSVEHPTVYQVLLRHSIDEGAESHPLHDTLHLYVERFDHGAPSQ